MYRPITTIKTAGAIIPIKGTKIDGRNDDANSLLMVSRYTSIDTLETVPLINSINCY